MINNEPYCKVLLFLHLADALFKSIKSILSICSQKLKPMIVALLYISCFLVQSTEKHLFF